MKLRFLILMLAVCLLPVCASAEEFVIDLPDKLTVIGEEAFMGDTSIGKVIMPEGMYWVGERAFADSSISGLEIPEGAQIYFQNNTFDGIKEDTEFYIQGIREGYIHTPGDQFEVEQLATGAYAVTGYKGTSAYVR